MKKKKVYLIYARTGCTCCCDENHYRGPYKTEEIANRRIKYYYSVDSKYWPLGSQFARRGIYSIQDITIEELPDGERVIVGDRVFDKDNVVFIDVKKDGTVEDDDAEVFWGFE